MSNQSKVEIRNVRWLVSTRTKDADGASNKTDAIPKSSDEETVKRYLDCLKTKKKEYMAEDNDKSQVNEEVSEFFNLIP